MAWKEEKFGNWFLDDIKEWVATNCEPDEVYDSTDLLEYIRANYNIDEVYKDEDIKDFLANQSKVYGYIEEE